MNLDETSATVEKLLNEQPLGVLATHGNGQPYGSLMAFAVSRDMSALYFCTGDATRKAVNLSQDCRTAMVIDNRANVAADYHGAIAVTAVGRAERLDSDSQQAADCLLVRHPHLREFVTSPSCHVYRLDVDIYHVVDHFQHVTELHVGQ